jgi:lipopolysaccharide/colanic/teichoic acid biosynthesis glycosyltransferase
MNSNPVYYKDTVCKAFKKVALVVLCNKNVKRECVKAFDNAVCLASSPAWLPIMMAGMIVSLCSTGQSPFYLQQRVGEGGRLFYIWKLRTYDRNGNIPVACKVLRKTKIDELPQLLFNILIIGNMALTGPRAHIKEEEISQNERRQSMLPGVTGWGQLIGGNNRSHAEELIADCAYRRFYKYARVDEILVENVRTMFATTVAVKSQVKSAAISYAESGLSTEISFGNGRVLSPDRPRMPKSATLARMQRRSNRVKELRELRLAA